MSSLIKMNLKLLLRNKGLLFFLLVTPAVSVIILSLKTNNTAFQDTGDNAMILELETNTDRAIYIGNTSACIIKVYDASKTDLSEYVLNEMAESGMFSICRCDVSDMTEEEVEEIAKRDAFDDRAGMMLYVKKGFDGAVLKGAWEQGIQLYAVSEDERQELFVSELTGLLGRIKQVQNLTGGNIPVILDALAGIEENIPKKSVVNLAGRDDVVLTDQQVNQRTRIGYAFAIVTLGFLFCGACVAHSVIGEQNNSVYTRIMLTKVSRREYFISKFIAVFCICIMQTLVLAACLALIPGLDLGMNVASFSLVILLLGLIFSTLSLLLGVMLGDAMSANYATFSIWSISALLAGLYFPLDHTTRALKALSYLMPQKWFMDASELLLTGDKSAYSVLLCVTAAYLIVFISVGGVGLKIKRCE